MRTLLLLCALLGACGAPGLGSSARAARQLHAAGTSARDVLKVAREDAPELVAALEAITEALDQAEADLRTHGDLAGLAAVVLMVEATIALATEAPAIAYSLVAVKGALLQLEAAR